jgi:hypothetical protein
MSLFGADHIENSFPYIVVTFLKGVFTSRRIETTVLLLLIVFVAVRMFTDIRLLLRNLATDCLPRICLCWNLFTSPLPGNASTSCYPSSVPCILVLTLHLCIHLPYGLFLFKFSDQTSYVKHIFVLLHACYIPRPSNFMNRDSAVCIATGYELDDRSVTSSNPGRGEIFSSLHTDRFWARPSLLSNGYRWFFRMG